jgi:VanZ family protein
LAGGSTRPSGLFPRYWLPLIAYVAMIFTLSAQPHLQPPLHFQNSDKVMHLSEYGVLGLLLYRLVRAMGWASRRDVAALLVLAMGMAIGGADERFQSIIPGRSCDVFDWLADSLGVGLAQVVSLAWTEWREG